MQTGVVMVIYLRGGASTERSRSVGRSAAARPRRDLYDAVVDGALLRLRPKIMTVSTVVAGLLPIMWSNRVGADVMKPLATPVLGGMVSSLLLRADRHAGPLLLDSRATPVAAESPRGRVRDAPATAGAGGRPVSS